MQIPDHAVLNAPSLMCDISPNLGHWLATIFYAINFLYNTDRIATIMETPIQIHFACKSLWPQVVTRSRPLSANEERERDALEMFPPSLDRILFISFIRASTYYVRKISGIFDPLPDLLACQFILPNPRNLSYNDCFCLPPPPQLERNRWMSP